ncbi:MAG: pyridoxamine 5'-phosphate oxidase [Alphaproteobacteria bacterium]
MNKKHPENPVTFFQEWLNKARETEINDPEAMALATSTKDGHPSVRMVLLKHIDNNGFKFHTNEQSQKGSELDQNPHAALCFHWKTLRKQVRVEGIIKKASQTEADEYFKNRPYARQIGAWASDQSRPLESREFLENKIAQIQNQYPEGSKVPRPPYWIGYRVIPQKMEFWWDNQDRLHDRILYTQTSSGQWEIKRLYP